MLFRSCRPRGNGRGGGLAVIHREKWKVLPVSVPAFSSFECLVFKLPGPSPTIIATFYRPPKPHSDFISEFSTLLTHISTLSPNVILLGDFNIHMDNINLPLTRDFASCLDSFGLHNLIDFPTHIKGHSLDLVCCSGLTPSKPTADVFPATDHSLLTFKAVFRLSTIKLPRLISFRDIKNINIATLCSLIDSFPTTDSTSNPDELVTLYNTCLTNTLTSIAPLKTRSVSFSTSAPWFTPELRSMKAKNRQLERLYKRTGLSQQHLYQGPPHHPQ